MLALFPLHVLPALLLILPIQARGAHAGFYTAFPLLVAVVLRCGRWMQPLGIWSLITERMTGTQIGKAAAVVMAVFGLAASSFSLSSFWIWPVWPACIVLLAAFGILALAGGARGWWYIALAAWSTSLLGGSGLLLGESITEISGDPLGLYALAQILAVVFVGTGLRAFADQTDVLRRPNTALFFTALLFLVSLQALSQASALPMASDNTGRIEPASHPLLGYAPIYGRDDGQTVVTERVRGKMPLQGEHSQALRVMLLGGSAAWGLGVDDRQTSSHLLENCLRWRSGKPVDVLNFGVQGYASPQFVLFYTLYLRELKPDIVIVYAGFNDRPPPEEGYTRELQLKSGFALVSRRIVRKVLGLRGADAPLFQLESWTDDPAGKLHGVAAMDYLRAMVRNLMLTGDQREISPVYSPEAFGENLSLLIRWAERGNARVLLCREAVSGTHPLDEYGDVMATLAREHGDDVLFLDTHAILTAGDPADLDERFIDSVHLDVRGHEMLARAWCDAITDAGWEEDEGP